MPSPDPMTSHTACPHPTPRWCCDLNACTRPPRLAAPQRLRCRPACVPTSRSRSGIAWTRTSPDHRGASLPPPSPGPRGRRARLPSGQHNGRHASAPLPAAASAQRAAPRAVRSKATRLQLASARRSPGDAGRPAVAIEAAGRRARGRSALARRTHPRSPAAPCSGGTCGCVVWAAARGVRPRVGTSPRGVAVVAVVAMVAAVQRECRRRKPTTTASTMRRVWGRMCLRCRPTVVSTVEQRPLATNRATAWQIVPWTSTSPTPTPTATLTRHRGHYTSCWPRSIARATERPSQPRPAPARQSRLLRLPCRTAWSALRCRESAPAVDAMRSGRRSSRARRRRGPAHSAHGPLRRRGRWTALRVVAPLVWSCTCRSTCCRDDHLAAMPPPAVC